MASALQCHRRFIVTPSWTFHDHGIPAAAVVWMDVLDIPFVNMLDAGFASTTRPTAPSGTKKRRRFAGALRR